MSSELVRRMRIQAEHIKTMADAYLVMSLKEAADRIERLEAETKRLSEALRDDRHARALASERRVDELKAENKRLREIIRRGFDRVRVIRDTRFEASAELEPKP